jgi:aspartate-semialdehyde dehydrogenase
MRIEAGVLGATGMVGQQLVRMLENHPWFELKWVAASERSAGRNYYEATAWRLSTPMPEAARGLQVDECKPGRGPLLVFSGLDARAAAEVEPEMARCGHIVVSNAGALRMEADVPLLIPEINPDHLKLLPRQKQRGWKGMVVTNPNCSAITLTMALAALERRFGLERVLVTTMQAVSGAGYPGVPSLDALANVIPFIKNEEEKVEAETRKILGRLNGDRVDDLPLAISAQTNRVAVIDGHTESISVELKRRAGLEELKQAWREFRGAPQERRLPTAPEHPVIVMEEPDRPQPRLDVDRENGMATMVGRARPCPVLHYKFTALGHNTVRGAAGAALLNAELMKSEGLF